MEEYEIDPHVQQLMDAASNLGIEVTHHGPDWLHEDCLELRYNGRREFIFDGKLYSTLGYPAFGLFQNKMATKALLKEAGFPVPDGFVFTRWDDDKMRQWLDTNKRIIIKPLASFAGQGAKTDIADLDEARGHYDAIRKEFSQFLTEEHINGTDVRIQIVGGRLAAASTRLPANVTGDGHTILKDLIEEKAAEKRALNPQNILDIDAETEDLLKEQQIDLEAVPENGQNIQLKRVANLSQGGDVVDITDELHPSYNEWMPELAELFGTQIFSVDMISRDHTADPQSNAWILELNSKSSWVHHTFSDGKTHDIATMILKSLFSIE